MGKGGSSEKEESQIKKWKSLLTAAVKEAIAQLEFNGKDVPSVLICEQKRGECSMSIKSFLLSFVLGALLVPASFVSASSLPEGAEDFALGGIRIGDSAADVEELYGEPDRVEDNESGRMGLRTYYYGDSLEVHFALDTACVYDVMVNGEDAESNALRKDAEQFATPGGIHIGSTFEDLKAVYGYIPKPHCDHRAPPTCAYFYEQSGIRIGFYICSEMSPGIRSIWLSRT